MSDTYHAINLHFVFGTKSRAPLLSDQIRVELFPYMGGIVRANESTLVHSGGVADHVHLLIGLPPKVAPSELMRDVKANSSRWMKERWDLPEFAWQDGFGVFSVSPSKLKATKDYLDGQAAHHARVSFGSELRAMYDAHGIEYDERWMPPV
ncbi:MAG: IS200/IS605 family transposase [Planctomycetes bacterium]|nr:IS200/IS605 family transposase [Planctomycetota bacterium]MCW8136677.1 IS200/IS605 family transposase [Planctomycetota bacterium]